MHPAYIISIYAVIITLFSTTQNLDVSVTGPEVKQWPLSIFQRIKTIGNC